MVGERGCVMRDLEYRLFSQVRSFSSSAVISAIVLAVGFSQFLGENSIHWQVAIAVIALAAGIPHGALDHLVTLPKSKPTVMALFICIYVLVAVIAVIAILEFNVFGFIFVLLMSATHFGIGDAAFINEMDRRGGRKAKLPRALYAIAAGSIPVLIPLVNSASTDALAQVNPALINWHQGFDQEILGTVSGFAVIAIVTLFLRRRKRESLDLALLLALALIAPPLIAFAVYFGCWHAMRHTARLTLALESSQRNYKEGNLRKVFLSAVIPGTPALVGTFVIAGVLALLGNEFNDDFFWMALVVVWALTVPHMAVTAKLDRSALT
jgi:Brp/Blh family beta-carotene 15,15'-monooxygenase